MKNNFLHKLFHWEYWPSYTLYWPNVPFALYNALKAKSLTFITAVNPGILNSGMGTESKFETIKIIPSEYLAETIFHEANSSIKKTIDNFNKSTLEFPVIVKPDVGFRGLLVEKVNSEVELIHFLKKYPVDILIQEFLSEENECGIFYYRYPNEEIGKITSITLKEFSHVFGDGKSTIKELIVKDKRAKLYLDIIKKNNQIDLDFVPEKNKKVNLSVIGNHSKGTKFINGNHLINSKLENSINILNSKIKGWFYGRLDIKFNSFEDLENGEFKILEINGILAEPTHIYDSSKTNYYQAVKEINNHWKKLCKIAKINHDLYGVKYANRKEIIKDLKALKKYTKTLSKL